MWVLDKFEGTLTFSIMYNNIQISVIFLKPSSTSFRFTRRTMWRVSGGLCRSNHFLFHFQGHSKLMFRLCGVGPTETQGWNQMKHEKVSLREQTVNCVWTFLLLEFTASRLHTSADRIFICCIVPLRHVTFSEKSQRSSTLLFCLVIMQPPVEKAKFDLMPITLFFFLSLPVSSYRFSNAFTASNYLYVTSIELLKLSCLRGSWLRLSEVDAVHTQASSLQAPMYCCHSLLRMDHYLALTTLHLKVIKYGHSQWYKCLQRGPGGVFITQ